MAYNVDLHPVAEVELWEAVDWYDDQKEDLGKSFAFEIQETVNLIRLNPTQFPVVAGNKRKAIVNRFPFVVVFEVKDNLIFILAIFHTRRNPKGWKRR
jgi:toxin ParE1/3/4